MNRKAPEVVAEHKRYLMLHYNIDQTRDQICRTLGRSISSVDHMAADLGLTKNSKSRHWEPEEWAILNEFAGLESWAFIKRKLDKLCLDRGWSTRSPTAIKEKIRRQGEPTNGDTVSFKSLEKLMRQDLRTLKKWLDRKEYVKVLKPHTTAHGTIIEAKNLRAFAIAFPGEFAKSNVDVVWLIGLVAGK
jgi:hypothetical protein